jgi:hypothetical protein
MDVIYFTDMGLLTVFPGVFILSFFFFGVHSWGVTVLCGFDISEARFLFIDFLCS